MIRDGWETGDRSQSGTLSPRDHGDPVRYRNIWFKSTAK